MVRLYIIDCILRSMVYMYTIDCIFQRYSFFLNPIMCCGAISTCSKAMASCT
jgi:hypothetical protein